MKRAQPVSSFSRRSSSGRTALVSLVLLCLVAAPGPTLAQDAGVSGIPPGPGNVNGLNGSVRDPSGIGNAARMPALPQQAAPVSPPALSAPNARFLSHLFVATGGQSEANPVCQAQAQPRGGESRRQGKRQAARSQADEHLPGVLNWFAVRRVG